MVNTVVLMGRLTADPELRHTQNGTSVTTFSLAVARSFAKAGEERQTDFINIVAWRNTAEFVSRYFTKGMLVAVEGSIQTRRYQDKDGNNRTAFEVVANQVHFAESKKSSQESQSASFAVPPVQQPAASFENGSFDDFTEIPGDDEDLPF